MKKQQTLITAERRLSECQSSETSNIRTHIFFVLLSNNEKSAITSRNKVLCHFYYVLYFVCTVLHCNGNIILEKHLDFTHCVASRFGYPNYRLSEISLVPISSYNRRSTVFKNKNILDSKLLPCFAFRKANPLLLKSNVERGKG